jgi:hypothetical protein
MRNKFTLIAAILMILVLGIAVYFNNVNQESDSHGHDEHGHHDEHAEHDEHHAEHAGHGHEHGDAHDACCDTEKENGKHDEHGHHDEHKDGHAGHEAHGDHEGHSDEHEDEHGGHEGHDDHHDEDRFKLTDEMKDHLGIKVASLARHRSGDAYLIPQSAVLTSKGKAYIYLSEGDKIEKADVTILEKTGKMVRLKIIGRHQAKNIFISGVDYLRMTEIAAQSAEPLGHVH